MKEEKIIINIDKNCKVTADADDFEGKSCLTEIESILDGFPLIDKIDRKPHFYKKKGKVNYKIINKNK